MKLLAKCPPVSFLSALACEPVRSDRRTGQRLAEIPKFDSNIDTSVITLNKKSHNALDLIRSDVRGMRGYTPGEQIGGATKLNTNESAFGPSPRVRAVMAAIADDALRLYPDPLSRRLRETAAATYGIAADQILAGNGSDDCLTILYRAFLSAGDEVRVPGPTYGLYDTLATLQGARLTTVPYRQVARRWDLPDELGAAGAQMVIVANPNNPSATLAAVEDLRRLCDRAPGIVVVDEAYIDFATGAGLAASMLPWLGEHDNLVVLRTFSKSYSLAGARLGLLFAAAPLVAELTKVKDSYNVNVITQALGVAALEDRQHHRQLVGQTLVQRTRLEVGLGALGFTWPESAANFLLCTPPPPSARAEAIYLALKAQGLLVRWWNTPELRDRLRITVGKPEDNDRLLVALQALVG
jgi:histidinol-phosphate aminotransferase